MHSNNKICCYVPCIVAILKLTIKKDVRIPPGLGKSCVFVVFVEKVRTFTNWAGNNRIHLNQHT